jgi:hypothetical protein
VYVTGPHVPVRVLYIVQIATVAPVIGAPPPPGIVPVIWPHFFGGVACRTTSTGSAVP